MGKKTIHRGRVCTAAGLLLIAAALGLTGYNLWDDARAAEAASDGYEKVSRLLPEDSEIWQGTDGTGEIRWPDYLLDPDMEMPELEVDGHAYIGTLELPTLGLSLPVLSEWSYPNLKLAPCRYMGSVYQENMVVAAHNYTRHFGNLKNINVGDAVLFTDADGNVFSYAVSEVEQLNPTAIEELEAGDWALSLFTCTVGGQYRIVVRCIPEETTDTK